MIGRALYDITQVLESASGAEERLRRVLELLAELVPYQQCALLEARLGHEPYVVAVPEPAGEERTYLAATLVALLGRLADRNASAIPLAVRPQGPHLAVPLVGLDEVMGVLFVRSEEQPYSEEHLRALSVVAAKLAAYLSMLSGRTELAALAHDRDEARRAAEAVNRAKDEFLALVSYELKTPLSSSLAWVHALRSTTDELARIRAIEGLEANIHSQAKLVDDILDLACIASAELRLNLRPIEPAALIASTIEGLRLEAERKSIRLESDLDAAAMPLVLDPDRIGQVLSILVASAINVTPTGGSVQVRLRRAAGFARIQVSDGGTGISSQALPQVFDRFPPAADAARRGEGGLGVGLAIVKDLVELHGGRVRAESPSPERGTTFTVDLPRRPEAALAEREPPPGSERVEGGLLAGLRVLLVDHDPGLRQSFRAVLEDRGAAVTTVASAPEALAALERQPPDVLLFGDLAVPGESMSDLMREVTARACALPIASISAWRPEEERGGATGFRLHLVKPLEVGTLIEAVAQLAGRRVPGETPRVPPPPPEALPSR
jgi:signal transduction histidine kinase